jgi:ribosomal protein L37AE/L43A
MSTEEKPSRNEEEYFARVNADLIKAQRAKLDRGRLTQERASHYMKCPKCGADLREREFHHMRIDECRECGGMWLDKGEMEMIAHVDRNKLRRFIGTMFGLKP